MKKPNDGDISELLSRGVGTFIDPEGAFKKKLLEDPKNVNIKFGVDPTRPDIHLGHAVVLRKLRKFQDLGCKVIFLVGDFTSLIGDPTGNSKTRPEIEQKEVEENMKTYLEQVGRILSTDKTVFSWIRNSDWFTSITDLLLPAEQKVEFNVNQGGKKITIPFNANSFIGKAVIFEQTRMQIKNVGKKNNISVITLRSFLSALKSITHSRLIERDMFKERISKGGELYMHEMMYPVLQGIDSSVLSSVYGSCDLEVGGTDQTFNMLMGRDIMRANKQNPQAVLSFEILLGLDGKEKMAKSLDNYIAITDEPNEMFGKIMSIPDSAIIHYFELCTYTPLTLIEKFQKDLEKRKNQKDIKMRLAHEIVEIYHGRENAKEAEKFFTETFSRKKIPENIPEVQMIKGENLSEVLIRLDIVSSKTEFRRLISKGAIENLEEKKIIESNDFVPEKTGTYRIGKKRFLKIIVSK